jgi:multicomponent K+:H+ antiporter subunit A
MAHQPHSPPAFMRIPVEALVVVCLLVGIAPALTVGPALHAAAVGVLGERVPEYSLSIWHGFNLPLLMSFAGVLGGVALYFGLRRFTHLYADVRASLGRQVFRWKLERIQNAADWVVDRFDNGSLQRLLGWTVLAAMLLGFAPFWQGSMSSLGGGQALPLAGWLLWAMLLASIVAVLRLRRLRLQAFITVGAIGLLVSLGFVLLSAPDLALTQLLVEVVTVMLVLLALNYLPLESPVEEPLRRRVRDALIAVLAGLGVAVFVYYILTQPFDTVAGEMLLRSKPEGGGTNVVNVILVDFRGFDTLGEITVFGVAGLVCHALLRRAKLIPDMVMPGPPDPLPIPNVVGRVLLPLAILVSVYLFLRGHNLPGGGFIAGLVLSVPLLLQYVLSGMHYVEPRIGLDYRGPIGWGVLIATATGLGSWLFAHPFMTSHTRYIDIPILGEVPFASAMFFDIGVYLVVFGTCMLAIAMLGHVRERKEAF